MSLLKCLVYRLTYTKSERCQLLAYCKSYLVCKDTINELLDSDDEKEIALEYLNMNVSDIENLMINIIGSKEKMSRLREFLDDWLDVDNFKERHLVKGLYEGLK